MSTCRYGPISTCTRQELLEFALTPSIVSRHGNAARFFDSLPEQIIHFVKTGLETGEPRLVDSAKFSAALRLYFGDATFGDAFARTGRIVAISITVRYGGGSGAHYARPLVLTYLTTPSVFIWSAVAASCAAPGLMRSVTLLARDHAGKTVPFHPVHGVTAIDGSMASDLPLEALSTLFRATRSIVSQCNPHVVPFLRDDEDDDGMIVRSPLSEGNCDRAPGRNLLTGLLWALELWLNLDVRQRCLFLAKLRLIPKFFGADVSSLFTQTYRGDVTILPQQAIGGGQWRALSQPTEVDMADFITDGARATWPHLARINALVGIEKALSRCLQHCNIEGDGVVISSTQCATSTHGTGVASTLSGAGLPSNTRSASTQATVRNDADGTATTSPVTHMGKGGVKSSNSPAEAPTPCLPQNAASPSLYQYAGPGPARQPTRVRSYGLTSRSNIELASSATLRTMPLGIPHCRVDSDGSGSHSGSGIGSLADDIVTPPMHHTETNTGFSAPPSRVAKSIIASDAALLVPAPHMMAASSEPMPAKSDRSSSFLTAGRLTPPLVLVDWDGMHGPADDSSFATTYLMPESRIKNSSHQPSQDVLSYIDQRPPDTFSAAADIAPTPRSSVALWGAVAATADRRIRHRPHALSSPALVAFNSHGGHNARHNERQLQDRTAVAQNITRNVSIADVDGDPASALTEHAWQHSLSTADNKMPYFCIGSPHSGASSVDSGDGDSDAYDDGERHDAARDSSDHTPLHRSQVHGGSGVPILPAELQGRSPAASLLTQLRQAHELPPGTLTRLLSQRRQHVPK